MINQRRLRHLLLVVALLALLIAPASALATSGGGNGGNHDRRTRFNIPPPNRDAVRQIAQLNAKHKKADARLIREMIETPQAVWFTKGTPKSVRQDVKATVRRAGEQHA